MCGVLVAAVWRVWDDTCRYLAGFMLRRLPVAVPLIALFASGRKLLLSSQRKIERAAFLRH